MAPVIGQHERGPLLTASSSERYRMEIRWGAAFQWLAFGLIAAELFGCANFRRLRADLHELEKLSKLSGRVHAGDWNGGPIDVYLFEVDESVGKPFRTTQFLTMQEPGKYAFEVDPGYYMIGAHEDLDGDEELGLGEPHAVLRDLEVLEIGPNDDRSGLNMELRTQRAAALDRLRPERVVVDYELHLGEVAQLEDERFDPSSGPMGMWQPHEFFEKYGAGIFMLQEYAEEKTPVLFIHGMSGHPREFATLIEGLDPQLYQAWVLQYPSGERIQAIVDGLHRILQSMHAKRGFERLCIVAHSMGGLVAHQLLRDQGASGTARYVRFLGTISSPLGGIPSADKGVKMAPGVVPSWRDVGPRSEFIQSLFDRPFPPDIHYALYFGYGNGSKATDGVVTIKSQLPRQAQDDASVVSGFAESHTGILRNGAMAQRLNRDLRLCLPQD
jgi:pimeloyl-ACP methyl ester carboxylesterase